MRISKIHTRAPSFEMNRPPKWCSQPRGGHLAQSWSWFCDFGRKLENLGVPVYIQWCSATDGRTRQHRVMDDSLLPFTSLRENLIQAYLDFSYFRTTEPKLLRLCARCHSQTCDTPLGRAIYFINKPAFEGPFIHTSLVSQRQIGGTTLGRYIKLMQNKGGKSSAPARAHAMQA